MAPRIDVAEVLDLLEIERPRAIWPAVTRCPLCRGPRLWSLQDSTGWHVCGDCRFRGNSIRLLSACWRVPQKVAFTRLLKGHANFDKIWSQYARDWNARQVLARFWQRASQDYPLHRDSISQALCHAHELTLVCSRERWVDGPGGLLGVTNAADVRDQFGRILAGHGWRTILACPAYDRPGRVAGLHFLGRRGAAGCDEAHTFLPQRSRVREAGLVGLNEAFAADPGLPVLAVSSWLTALRLHFRNFNITTCPLPLVAWHYDQRYQTHDAWRSLLGRSIIFWDTSLSPALILQAQETGGKIVLEPHGAELDADEAADLATGRSAAQLTQALSKRARSWQDVLRIWLSKAGGEEGRVMITELQQRGVDTDSLLEECGTSFRRFQRDPETDRKEVLYQGLIVREQNRRWYLIRGKRKQVLLNGVLRIHRVRHVPDAKGRARMVYDCQFSRPFEADDYWKRYGNEKRHPRFTVDAAKIRGDFVLTITAVLKKMGAPVPRLLAAAGGEWLCDIACLFYPPKTLGRYESEDKRIRV